MNTRRITTIPILFGLTGIGLLLGLLWVSAAGSLHAVKGVAAPGINRPHSIERTNFDEETFPSNLTLTTADTVTCTLEYTTTDKRPFDNHTLNTAASIGPYTDQSLLKNNGNVDDEIPVRPDYYRLDNAVVDQRYTIEAKPDFTLNYNLGLIVYNRSKQPILTDTNQFNNNWASVTFVAANNGPYYFKVFQITEQCSGGTYSLELDSATPTPTPTHTPTETPTPTGTPKPTHTPQPDVPTPRPTWRSGFDQYEPNFDFSLATTLAPGVEYTMNFIPWGTASVDNDFLRIRVKPRLQLTCETSDLDPGVDPRMVFYRGPSESEYIAANDDIELGNFNSRLSYYTNYEGYVYILIGQGQRMDARDTVESQYTVSCELEPPTLGTIQPTPAPGQTVTPLPDKDPVRPTATPWPTATPDTPASPLPTPTEPPDQTQQDRQLSFRLVSQPEPSDPTGGTDGVRTFRVVIYLDENRDKQFGAGEGITGFFVMVIRPETKTELAQGYTDEQGQISFTVASLDSVRILVPMLGYDRIIPATQPEVIIRINPTTLPDTIP